MPDAFPDPQITKVGDKSILFVMAALPEYGEALRARIKPLFTGIGPVEGAVQLTNYLATCSKRPDLIVSLGSAGSARLKQGEIYQASHIAYRDMDASPLGFERGRTPLLDLPAQIEIAISVPGIEQASLSTGANIVSGAEYERVVEEMVDMESFAHLRAAQNFDIPMIGLRGISDGDKALEGLEDWTRYLAHIDEKLAEAVDTLLDAIKDGLIAL